MDILVEVPAGDGAVTIGPMPLDDFIAALNSAPRRRLEAIRRQPPITLAAMSEKWDQLVGDRGWVEVVDQDGELVALFRDGDDANEYVRSIAPDATQQEMT